MSDDSTKQIALGFVRRAHGIRGQLRIECNGDALPAFKTILLCGKKWKITSLTAVPGAYLMSLEGLQTRTEAETFKGETVFGERQYLPALANDLFYVADLIGCEVYDRQSNYLGKVSDSFFSGAQEILNVEGQEPFLLPFVDAFIVSVDCQNKRIICDPPEGLVNLNQAETAQ